MLRERIMLAVVVILLVTPAFADNVIVTKTASANVKFGQNLDAIITVTNNLSYRITADVREMIGNAQTISPQPVAPQNENPNVIAALPPYFEWTLQIDGNSQKNITYTIKPNKVGYYLFSPTTVTANGKTFYSNTLSTFVECNLNNVCETQYGEDYTNCADCATPRAPGTQGGYCADCATNNTSTSRTIIGIPNNVDPIMLASAAIFVLVAFLYYVFRMMGKGDDLYKT